MTRRTRRPSSVQSRVFVALFCCGAVAACAGITDLPLPAGSRAFTPPPAYDLWWSMTQGCSGRTGALGAIEWYVVPGATQISDGRDSVSGYWEPARNRIVLAEAAWLDGSLVRHEMLHALLRDAGHPRSAFLEQCGGVVACVGACVRDAGPPPVPGDTVLRVPPDSIDVDVTIAPSQPNSATYGGYFTITVTAHNPADRSAVVLLPPSGDAGPSGSFSYRIDGGSRSASHDDRVTDVETLFFLPGETKRDVFDFLVGGPADHAGIAPGTYTVRGAYGWHWSAPHTIVILQ